jgi:hypothetical protein
MTAPRPQVSSTLLPTRTARLGYPMFAAIAANITIIDWSFDFPAQPRWLATFLLVGSLYLLVRERRAYLSLVR